MKVIKLPVKTQQTSSLRINTKGSDVDHNDKISPTSTATTQPSPSPPSPQLSWTSQASSLFTYTGNMSKFTPTNNKKNIGPKSPSAASQYSKFSLDVPSIDLNLMRGGRQDPPAFGSDISVIGQPKDLSLIPEEQGDLELGVKKNERENTRTKNSRSSKRYLSNNSRVALDARHSRSRTSSRSETYFYSGSHVNDNDSDCTSDVICDLKNLSIQIQQQRDGRRSSRGLNQ